MTAAKKGSKLYISIDFEIIFNDLSKQFQQAKIASVILFSGSKAGNCQSNFCLLYYCFHLYFSQILLIEIFIPHSIITLEFQQTKRILYRNDLKMLSMLFIMKIMAAFLVTFNTKEENDRFQLFDPYTKLKYPIVIVLKMNY